VSRYFLKKIIFLIFLFYNILYSQTFLDLNKEEKEFINKKQRVYISIDKNFLPFIYMDNNLPKGYIVDYMKLLSKKVGLEPIFLKRENKDIEQMIIDKDIDIVPAITYSRKNEKLLNFTKPYIEQTFTIVNKEETQFNSMDELKYKKLGMLKDRELTNYLRKEYSNSMRIIEFDSIEDIFEAIKENFIDATILNNLEATHYINNFYLNQIKISSQIKLNNFNSSLHLGIRKDLKIVYDLYEKALNSLTKDEINELDTIWINSSKKLKLTSREIEFIKNKSINIAYTDHWAPLSFHENNKAKGLGFDFWEYIAKENDIKYKTNLKKNFVSALKSIKNKEDDIIITTSKTKDREEYAIFSNVYFKAPIGIATLQNRDYIPNIQAIANKKIGVGKNHTAHRILKEYYPDLEFVFIDNAVDGLDKLSNNQIFALVDIMPVLAHNIDKYGYSNVKISGSTGINFDLQMMIREDYEVLQSIINKTLLNLELEEKNTIYNKWSKINYKEPFDYNILWKLFLPLLIIIFIILYKNRQLLKYQKTLNETKNELENSLESFKALVDLTIEGIAIIQNKKVIFINNEMTKIFNLEKDELINSSINSLFELNNEINILEIIKDSHSSTFEINALKNYSTSFPCIVKAKNIIFENRASTILSIIDISEIKEKESILINQSKMASLGEMIGNIAHQWRQPLSIISSSATGLKLQKEYSTIDDDTLISALDNINDTTKFLSQTIDDFQDYLKKDKEKTNFNLALNINKVLNILKANFENHEINIILKIEKELSLYTYENELKQVILNILNNSKDAIKNFLPNKKYIEISAFSRDDFTHIIVIDNGGGVDLNIINKVFEPYFTTKHKKQGTGLGLYMTHKIITESMNGEIYMENTTYTFDGLEYTNCAKTTIKIPNL